MIASAVRNFEFSSAAISMESCSLRSEKLKRGNPRKKAHKLETFSRASSTMEMEFSRTQKVELNNFNREHEISARDEKIESSKA
jgi:hypothetical protein